MIAAAAAAMIGAANAGIAITNCHKTVSQDCDLVFKVTASGKTVVGTEKGDVAYDTTVAIKVTKGALVLFGTADAAGDCCYDTYSLYLPVKVGKEQLKLALLQGDIEKWSIFGKNLEAALYADKSKKFKLESDFGISFGDDSDTTLDAFDEVTGIQMIATAFGNATYTYKVGKETKVCNICVPGADTTSLVPGNYKGWFAGIYDAEPDCECMTCDCADIQLFGGTWTAKYNKAMSNGKGSWVAAANYAFGSSIAKAMVEEEVE